MSAFMMDSKTTAMLAEELIKLVEYGYVTPRLPQHTFISNNDKEVIIKACRKWNNSQAVPVINPIDSKVLFGVMEAMNDQALNERYGDEPGTNVSTYPNNVSKPANMPALYKSLQCYLYQCCEGKVPETELYKTLENICNTFAKAIIQDLPEYETAVWG